MPSVTDGLSTDGTGELSDDPFEVSLAAKLAADDQPESVEPAAEAPSGPPRDPATGKFVPATPTEEEGTPVSEDVAALQARLAEKDSFIGRQSTEIGELRSRLEALEAARTEPEEYEAPEINYIPEDVADNLVERLGPEGALQAAMTEGLDPNGQPFKVIFDAAAEAVESQSQLADLVEARLMYRQAIEAPEQVEQAPDPAVEFARSAYQENILVNAVNELKERIPDFSENIAFFEQAAATNPAYFDQEISSGDPQRVQTALALLNDAARGVRFSASLASKEAEAANAAQARQAKQAAMVTTGSLRTAEQGTPGQEEGQDAIAAFKSAFAAAVRPSVQDGLTLE